MTTQTIGLFKAISAKMSYLDTRKRVLAQNVANADTPGYQPMDLTPVDFGRVLDKVTGARVVRPETTHVNHLPPPGELENAKNREQEQTYEVAPAGNAVILEEQLIAAQRTTMDHSLMTGLYRKNMTMLRVAMGQAR